LAHVPPHEPQAVLQFEDFNLEHAQPLLERYRFHHLVFNDDIQALTALFTLSSICFGIGWIPKNLQHRSTAARPCAYCQGICKIVPGPGGPLLRRPARRQGTAATALAGLYGALAVQGKPVEAIKDQRVVVVGAGSAGMGVVSMIAAGPALHHQSHGVLWDVCCEAARLFSHSTDGLVGGGFTSKCICLKACVTRLHLPAWCSTDAGHEDGLTS